MAPNSLTRKPRSKLNQPLLGDEQLNLTHSDLPPQPHSTQQFSSTHRNADEEQQLPPPNLTPSDLPPQPHSTQQFSSTHRNADEEQQLPPPNLTDQRAPSNLILRFFTRRNAEQEIPQQLPSSNQRTPVFSNLIRRFFTRPNAEQEIPQQLREPANPVVTPAQKEKIERKTDAIPKAHEAIRWFLGIIIIFVPVQYLYPAKKTTPNSLALTFFPPCVIDQVERMRGNLPTAFSIAGVIYILLHIGAAKSSKPISTAYEVLSFIAAGIMIGIVLLYAGADIVLTTASAAGGALIVLLTVHFIALLYNRRRIPTTRGGPKMLDQY